MDRPLRILLSHVYSWPEVRRGGERYLHELSAALAGAGHHVEVLTTARRPGRSKVLGVPVTYLRRRQRTPRRLNSLGPEMLFGFEAGMWALLRRFDVWHAMGTADAAAAVGLRRARGWRTVHTTLGIPDRAYRDSRPDRRLHDYVVRRVDGYVCLSDAAGRALKDGWGRDPVVIGGGVDLSRFVPSGVRHGRPAVLFSGNFFEPRKNLPLLLEAIAVMRTRRPDVELWLSGGGDPSGLLAAAPPAAADAAVLLGTGTEGEQAGRYSRAWVTVLPSEDEAFGLAVVESLACGTPVVVLEGSGGPAELVETDVGIVTQKSAEALADACEAAFELSNRPGISEACRAVAERHGWEQSVVPKLEAVYRGG